MTVMPQVSVIEIEHPISVEVDTGTPIISITDNVNPGATVVTVHAQQVTAVIADHKPEVHVRIGRGSLSDRTVLMDLLVDQMDVSELTPELRGDIYALRDFFGRMGQNIYDYMTDADIDRILQTAMTLTDERIQLTALDIVKLDEAIDARMADISLTASAIQLQVTHLEWETTGSFTAQNSLIDQTSEYVNTTVLRLDNLMNPDGSQGLIVQMQSQINQEADRITQEVLYREALDGIVTEQSTRVTQTALAIETVATATDAATGRLNTATERLTATEKVISILSKGLNDGAYSIETIMALTASSFGVVIEETIGGIPYAAGFEVLMYPQWMLDTPYVIGDIITFSDTLIYKCILNHTSLGTNSPGSVGAAMYWVNEPDKERTEFNVNASHFQVITPGGLIPIFDVNGTTGKVTINGDLVTNTIESLDYAEGDPSKKWFLLDADTGVARFNNMEMTFGTSQAEKDFKDSIGIVDQVLYNWSGSSIIKSSASMSTASAWSFESEFEGGALIEINVDDSYAGELQIALNDMVLTVDLFGDTDFGDVTAFTPAFEGEGNATNYNDLSTGGKTFDLGDI